MREIFNAENLLKNLLDRQLLLKLVVHQDNKIALRLMV